MQNAITATRGSRVRRITTVGLGVLLFCGGVAYAFVTYGLAEGFGYANWHSVREQVVVCCLFALAGIGIIGYGLLVGRSSKQR